jgi:hypothetical protein
MATMAVRAAPPPTSDPTMDWLLSQQAPAPAATQPTTHPATMPLTGEAIEGGRPGVVEMSDGTRVGGQITTTAEKPLRVWVEADKQYQDIPFALVRSIEAKVLWERDEREWRFAASGSDVKEYSGKTYPARETSYKLTLRDGQTIEGAIVAPLYVREEGQEQSRTYVLHKRDKGEVGQTLPQLLYVKRVTFSD